MGIALPLLLGGFLVPEVCDPDIGILDRSTVFFGDGDADGTDYAHAGGGEQAEGE